MADLVITAANVVKGTGAVTQKVTAGATVTAGQPVFKAADGKYDPAQADSATDDDVAGIALHGASDGQPLEIQTSGQITIGATLTLGVIYVLSATAGGIAPDTDLVATNYVTVIGVPTTTAILELALTTTSSQHP